MFRYPFALALLAMTIAIPGHCRPPSAMITGFSVDPAAAAFGAPIAPGSPIGLQVSGYGECQVSFLIRTEDGTGTWREAAFAKGRLPLSAMVPPLPVGNYGLALHSDCAVGSFLREFHLHVADKTPILRQFADTEAPRCSQLALGEAPQIMMQCHEDRWTVSVLANFGCQTTAGAADAWLEGDALVLFAKTMLPNHPTPHCLCTRKLSFLVAASTARRIRYHQDQRPPVDTRIDDRVPQGGNCGRQ